MAKTLSAEQKAEFSEAFLLFDKTGDKKIDCKELGSVLRSLGMVPTDKEILDLINEVDSNASGTIELSEFLEMMSNHIQETSSEEQMRAVFKMFDKGGDGVITPASLAHVFASLGEKLTSEEIEEMISTADTHGTGRVNYEDFVAMVTSK